MTKIDLSLTMAQLLERFPKGFAIAPEGYIFEVVAQTKQSKHLPQLVTPGGYIAVAVPQKASGDERFFLAEPDSHQEDEIAIVEQTKAVLRRSRLRTSSIK